jgi:hypothetical protein
LSIAGSQTGAASYANLDGSGANSFAQGLQVGNGNQSTMSQSGSESKTVDGLSTSTATSLSKGEAGTTTSSITT